MKSRQVKWKNKIKREVVTRLGRNICKQWRALKRKKKSAKKLLEYDFKYPEVKFFPFLQVCNPLKLEVGHLGYAYGPLTHKGSHGWFCSQVVLLTPYVIVIIISHSCIFRTFCQGKCVHAMRAQVPSFDPDLIYFYS